MRSNLFIKIFLGFWLVIIAIIVSWSIAAKYFQDNPASQPRSNPSGPPREFMLRLMYDMQHLPLPQLEKRLAKASSRSRVQIYLLDGQHRDIFDKTPPVAAVRVARQLNRDQRRKTLRTPEGHIRAHLLYREDKGQLKAVIVIPPLRPNLVNALGADPRLRFGLAVLVSGLLSFALSRLVTRRLQTLRRASHRFAQGELDTRLAVRTWGRDETDDLAADFNAMAQDIQQRIDAQRRLLSDVSHELRSPLARLRIALALAQEDSQQAPAHLARIEQETEQLETLISELLSSHAACRTLDDHIDLVALLTELCADATFEGQHENKRVSFSSEVDQAVIATSGDLLKRSFENLLRNALQHTPADSIVTVQLNRVEQHYVIHVEDQGPGVPEAELDSIFKEFYRVDSARSRKTGGYGLGLAIASRAIHQHGGAVSARNTRSSLAVTVELPCPAETDFS